ncbi:MAG: TonB-dependent receptor [Alphaproteobacteria bacterium]|nr:TonB-dependent receptor [Alphaproteobacteria bacterium]
MLANYNWRRFGLSGLDTNLGVLYQSEREANSANEFQLPGFVRVDLAAGYTFKNDLQVRVNIQNIFDETYYTSAQDRIFGAGQVAVGDRRLFQVTATKRF